MKKHDAKAVTDQLLADLQAIGAEPYLWAAATTGSFYIRFKNPLLGSVRVADHPGREQYKYKYNVRADVHAAHWVKDGDAWRYFVPIDQAVLVVDIVKKRMVEVAGRTPRFQYGIPKHLRPKNKL